MSLRRRLLYLGIPILGLAIAYLAGPKPKKPKFDKRLQMLIATPQQLEALIRAKEQQHKVKPDNEARIVWADTSKQKN